MEGDSRGYGYGRGGGHGRNDGNRQQPFQGGGYGGGWQPAQRGGGGGGASYGHQQHQIPYVQQQSQPGGQRLQYGGGGHASQQGSYLDQHQHQPQYGGGQQQGYHHHRGGGQQSYASDGRQRSRPRYDGTQESYSTSTRGGDDRGQRQGAAATAPRPFRPRSRSRSPPRHGTHRWGRSGGIGAAASAPLLRPAEPAADPAFRPGQSRDPSGKRYQPTTEADHRLAKYQGSFIKSDPFSDYVIITDGRWFVKQWKKTGSRVVSTKSEYCASRNAAWLKAAAFFQKLEAMGYRDFSEERVDMDRFDDDADYDGGLFGYWGVVEKESLPEPYEDVEHPLWVWSEGW